MKDNYLKVYYQEALVGELALYKRHLVAFEYSDLWLEHGFSISPFSLPLEKRVFIPKENTFDGLFGVFNDSLPDGWGRLLVDCYLQSQGIELTSVNNLMRLGIVGDTGMGALSYVPGMEMPRDTGKVSFDELARDAKNVLASKPVNNLDQLFEMGGSSGGARPKILTTIDGEEWIVKFPSSIDNDNIGSQEYRYSICAKECGIKMPQTRLFPSKICEGYFGVQRFDRYIDKKGVHKKRHMVSASGLLETSHRIPNLDYNILMELTLKLTRSYEELKKMFLLMCFNVFAHNRDDHSKNFSYLFNEERRNWTLSPAYDLTYSNSFGGEHATTVNGNGKNPGEKELLEVAGGAGLDMEWSKIQLDRIRQAIFLNLQQDMV